METIKSNKIGKFKVSIEVISESPQTVRAIMAECIVLGVEFHDYNGVVIYTAISDCFEEVPEGKKIPFYYWELTRHISGRVLVSSCRREIETNETATIK